MKETVRINFEFPREEYPYLKLACAKLGVSLREFATKQLLEAVEEHEDLMLAQTASERLDALNEDDLIDWDDARRLAGWDDDSKDDLPSEVQ